MLAELTRPGANRQVLTRFTQHQHASAIAAVRRRPAAARCRDPAEGLRRTRLSGFAQRTPAKWATNPRYSIGKPPICWLAPHRGRERQGRALDFTA